MTILTPKGEHPNRRFFRGVLLFVDETSDKAPSGARGHRTIVTRAAAKAALPTLLGMAVGYKKGWNGHDARQKVGIITSAQLVHNRVEVRGYVFVRDFPEFKTTPDLMGMSFESADAHVVDMRQAVWTIERLVFTGAAILLKEKAAYQNTSFRWEGKRDVKT